VCGGGGCCGYWAQHNEMVCIGNGGLFRHHLVRVDHVERLLKHLGGSGEGGGEGGGGNLQV
jgi:hypothetical protein